MTARRQPRIYDRWAQLRFSVVGQLLADPPAKGTLQSEINKLSLREWRHPATGEPVRFGCSTIQRWYYKALRERSDPVSVLRRKPRQDAGHQASMTAALRQVLRTQHAAHPNWSAQLHHDNLVAEASNRSELGLVPSYSTIRRYLKAQGLEKRRRVTSRRTAGALVAEAKLAQREVRGYEAEYCGSLLHWDCHFASRKVLTRRGEWQTPVLFGVLDDHSRLVCHLQWYWAESAANIAHGLSQAFMKRGLPRAAMSDNGSAMTATEIAEGLLRLGVLHETTLPFSPYMNGKLEHLWAVVEARLMAMLEGVADLTLAMLNQATQAWVEPDYNRKHHSEIGEAPLDRFLRGPSVMRPCPDSAALKRAFTRTEQRTQRKSDGTITIDARRFEVPNQYRHLSRLEVRYASWDLTEVHLVDERLGQVLCRLFPQDKARNANGLRRSLDKVSAEPVAAAPSSGLLALYGLKYNPFVPGVPTEALQVSPRIDSFRRRVAQLAVEGGFALVTGNPGTGKSAALRILAEHLADQRDVKVGLISRPQANLADFYREMGDLFGTELRPHNRWGGTKILRQRWQTHIDSALSRPVLIIDEAQEMLPQVLSELRLLSSARVDSHILLTVVLAGDGRLVERLRSDEFLPLDSRIRVRLPMERATPDVLQGCLRHLLAEAGAPALMVPDVIATLADHAQGNLRSLMIMADELLAAAAERKAERIDEALLFEACALAAQPKAAAGGRRR